MILREPLATARQAKHLIFAARPRAAAWLWAGACVYLLFSFCLRAQQPSTDLIARASNFTTSVSAPSGYIISPDDELEVQVLDVPEISGSYRVGADGTLALPLLTTPLSAQGLTLEQLGEKISAALRDGGMVSHPSVTVRVKASWTHSIAIGGAVKKPQIYPVFSKITLMDALSQAEGLADDAGDTAVIVRGETGNRTLHGNQASQPSASEPSSTTQTVNLKRLLEEGEASANLDLYPGDRVTVRRAGIVYVVGGVNRAGGFALNGDRSQLTVLEAVALAGDLKSTAVGKKAVIIRNATPGSGGDQEVPVNVDKILSGISPAG